MGVTLGDATVFISGDDKKLSNSLDSAQRKTQGFISNLGNVLNNALGVALGNAINAGFSKLDQAIRGAISTGYEAVAGNERLRQSYESLIAAQLKSADSTMSMAEALAAAAPMAEELYNWTVKLGIKSPFEQDDISKALQLAQSYKFNNQQAKELVETFVDVAAATGQSGEVIERATRALGQMAARSKVSQEELNQLSEIGIDYISTLEKMGLTLDDVAKGTVNANEFIKQLLATLQGNFAGAAERQATSWAGLASTFQDITRIGLRELFSGVLEVLQPLAGAVTDAFSNPAVLNGMRMIGQTIGELITPAVEKLTRWFEALPEKISTAVGFLQQLKDELQGLSAADIMAGLGPGLAKLQSDLALALDALDRAHVGMLEKLQADIGKAGDKLAEEMAKLAEKYAPDIAKLQQRIDDATIDFNQRATDQAEQFAKRRADIEKRLTKSIADQEEKLTELKKDHQKRRQQLVFDLMFAESEEQYLQIQKQLQQEDEKYNEQKTKQETAGKEQQDELRAQLAEQEAEQKKADDRLAQQRARAFRDMNQAMDELTAKKAEEEAKLQEAYDKQVELLNSRIEAENTAYEQQRQDLQTSFQQAMADLETSTIARAEAIGKGMAHTIATFIKDFQASFNAEGFSGVLDMLIAKIEAWATDPANQAKLQSFGEMIGLGIANGILSIDIASLFSGKLVEQFQGGLQAYLDIGGRIAGATLTGIIEGLTGLEVSQRLTDTLANVWRGVIQTIITTLFPALGLLFAQEQYNQIKSAFEGMSWGEIGAAIWDGITGGLAEAARGVKDDVEEAGGDLLDGIKNFFGIDSPSKLFRDQVGAQLAAGLGEGFQAGLGDVAKKAQEALAGLTPARLQPALANVRQVHLTQTNYLPAAPNGFDRGGLLQEIDQRTLKLLLEMENA
jgi:tape measure domain-containing protein